MSTRTKRILALGAVAVVVALVVMRRNTQTQPANAVTLQPTAPAVVAPQATTIPASAPVGAPLKSSAPMAAPAQTSSPIPPAAPRSATATVAVASTQQPLVPVSEVTATRQMIAAHAPLRTPEVADPDSAANRQVLQTMVTKALSRAEKKP